MSDDERPTATVTVIRGHEGRPVAVPEDVVIASERPWRAYQLLQSGHSWKAIALAEGYPSWQAARADVQRYLAEGAELVGDFTRRQLLQMEVDRLNELQRAVWDKAMAGQPQMVNQALAIILSRAKLLKLDQDVRDEAEDLKGRTVVVPNDEEGYSASLEQAGRKEITGG